MTDVKLSFKDTQGYENEVLMKDIIVISHCPADGIIVVETCKHGTFAFYRKDAKTEVYVDREYVLDNGTMFHVASELGLTKGGF